MHHLQSCVCVCVCTYEKRGREKGNNHPRHNDSTPFSSPVLSSSILSSSSPPSFAPFDPVLHTHMHTHTKQSSPCACFVSALHRDGCRVSLHVCVFVYAAHSLLSLFFMSFSSFPRCLPSIHFDSSVHSHGPSCHSSTSRSYH